METSNSNAWRPALLIFFRISTWIVIPLVIAVLLGKWLDAHFGTKPLIFIALAVIAFTITCIMIVRIIRKFIKDTEKNSTTKGDTESKQTDGE